MNYFELFGLPTQFSLDSEQLLSVYRRLQQQFHPDHFAAGSERDRRMAVEQAATINEAYYVLRRPLSRAIYLLELQGIEIQNEQQTFQDPAFLMTQMTLRETLEEVPHSADPLGALTALEQEVSQLRHSLETEINQRIVAEQWQQAVDPIRKLQFIVRLEQQIEQQEDALF